MWQCDGLQHETAKSQWVQVQAHCFNTIQNKTEEGARLLLCVTDELW